MSFSQENLSEVRVGSGWRDLALLYLFPKFHSMVVCCGKTVYNELENLCSKGVQGASS